VLPKTLLLTGSRDLLSPDSLIFAAKARAAGVDIEVLYEKGMFHVWPLIDMPEARRARDRIVEFLKQPSSAADHRLEQRTIMAPRLRTYPSP
jgi:acetyl esterase/lipase